MKSIFSLFSLLVGVLVFGQNINPAAKKQLDDMSALYNKNTSSYFKFIIKSPNMNQNKPQVGLYYQQNEKYLLKIMTTEQLFDGKKLHIINNEEQEVSIAKPDGNNQALSPMMVFSKYKNGYSIQFAGKNSILLTPIKAEGIKQIIIDYHPKTNQIVAVKQYDLNGAVSSLSITQYKANLKLNASMFQHNKKKYANYLVTEL